MAETLFHKVWNAHRVRTLASGQTQLFIGLHLVHEVTSPQAFDMLRQQGLPVAFPERTVATIDHIVPTSSQKRPFLDVMAEEMTVALERNCRDFGIRLYTPRYRRAGDRPRHRSAARPDAARADDRVRRQPHVHARRLRRHRDGHRHLAGPRRPGLAVPGGRAAEGPAHRRQRPASAGRVREGRDSHDHPPARRPGRRGLRLRIRRQHARSHVDGRADDHLQHVHRRRRPRRLRQPGRHDVRVPEGPPVRSRRATRATRP